MATKTVGALNFNITASMRQFNLSMNLLRGQLTRAKVNTDNLSKKTKESAESQEGLNKALAKSISFYAILAGLLVVIKSVKLAGELEQTAKSFEIFLGSADKATKLVKDIQQLSATTPLLESDLHAAAKRLLSFGIAHQELMPTLRALGDISAATGEDIREFARILGQARNTGKVLTRDLYELANRGIPVYEELAHVMGVSVKDVSKYVEKGQVRFEHLQMVIARLTSVTAPLRNDLQEVVDKVRQMGRVTMSVVDDLEKRNIPVFEKLKEVLQVKDNNALENLIRSGRVSADDLEKALKLAERGRFAGAAEALSETMLGQFSNLVDNVTILMAQLGKIIIEELDLTGGIKSLNEYLFFIRNVWWDEISAVIKDFFWLFKQGLKLVGWLWNYSFGNALDSFVRIVKTMVTEWHLFEAALVETFRWLAVEAPMILVNMWSTFTKEMIHAIKLMALVNPVLLPLLPKLDEMEKGAEGFRKAMAAGLTALAGDLNNIPKQDLKAIMKALTDSLIKGLPSNPGQFGFSVIIEKTLMDMLGNNVIPPGGPGAANGPGKYSGAVMQSTQELLSAINKANQATAENKALQVQQNQLAIQRSIDDTLKAFKPILENLPVPVFIP